MKPAGHLILRLLGRRPWWTAAAQSCPACKRDNRVLVAGFCYTCTGFPRNIWMPWREGVQRREHLLENPS